MYIKVRVVPNSKKEIFKKVDEDTFSIHVKDPAKGNMANRRVTELLKGYFGNTANIRLVSGHRSPSKIFHIDEK